MCCVYMLKLSKAFLFNKFRYLYLLIVWIKQRVEQQALTYSDLISYVKQYQMKL